MTLFKNGHLTKSTVDAFYSGVLDGEQTLLVCEHTAICTQCADMLADGAISLLSPPKGFSEFTGERINSLVQKKKSDFSQYCMRVAISAAAAIFIVFSGFRTLPVFASTSESLPEPKASYSMTEPSKTNLPKPKKETPPEPQKFKSLTEIIGDWFSSAA